MTCNSSFCQLPTEIFCKQKDFETIDFRLALYCNTVYSTQTCVQEGSTVNIGHSAYLLCNNLPAAAIRKQFLQVRFRNDWQISKTPKFGT